MTQLAVHRKRDRASAVVALCLAIALGACGGSDSSTSPNSARLAAKAAPSGDAQTGVVGQVLGAQLRVIVTQGGTPVAGAAVAWAVTGGGGTVAVPASVTADDGIATTPWTLGTTAGAQTMTATVAGASGSPLTFTATATPGPPSSMISVTGNGQSGATGFALPLALVVRVRDAFGNAVGGVPVSWSVSAGQATLAASASTSNAQGDAQMSVTLGPVAGMASVSAAVQGLSGSPVVFAATAVAAAEFISEIEVGNNFFLPSSVTIPAGSRVRWTWRNTFGVAHNVTSVAQPAFPNSAPSLAGDGVTYQHVFALPGTYRYECTLHAGMTGTVVVQ